MGCEPAVVRGRPCDSPGCAASTYPSVSLARRLLTNRTRKDGKLALRFIGMDVHRDFCEVAIAEQDGKVRSVGRVASTVEALEVMAQSLAPDDVVALEANQRRRADRRSDPSPRRRGARREHAAAAADQ